MKAEVLSQFPEISLSLIALGIFTLTFIGVVILAMWGRDPSVEKTLSALPFLDGGSK